jgi:hypothetical protein
MSIDPARFVFFLSCAVSVGCCSMMVLDVGGGRCKTGSDFLITLGGGCR